MNFQISRSGCGRDPIHQAHAGSQSSTEHAIGTEPPQRAAAAETMLPVPTSARLGLTSSPVFLEKVLCACFWYTLCLTGAEGNPLIPGFLSPLLLVPNQSQEYLSLC